VATYHDTMLLFTELLRVTPIVFIFPYFGSYPYSSKYHILCSTKERHSFRFGTTWGWV